MATLILVLSILFLLIVIIDYKLLRETLINFFDRIYGASRFAQTSAPYRKENERCSVSPKISVNGGNYRVMEFGTYGFNPTDSRKLTGFLVFNETGELVKEKEISNQLVNLYLFWRKLYFDPIFAKQIKTNNPLFFKSSLNFYSKINKIIEKRQKEGYNNFKVKEKDFIEILKRLDNDVIEQYPIITNKLQASMEISNQLDDVFLRPSSELYDQIYDKINTISRMSDEENKIWGRRLTTWEKLYNYYGIEIDKLPEANFGSVFTGIFGDLIDFFVLKQQLYPVGGATIAGITVEGSKKVKKETLKYINHTLIYHKMGIDAIKKNIQINKELKKVCDEYGEIMSSDNVHKIRNFY